MHLWSGQLGGECTISQVSHEGPVPFVERRKADLSPSRNLYFCFKSSASRRFCVSACSDISTSIWVNAGQCRSTGVNSTESLLLGSTR